MNSSLILNLVLRYSLGGSLISVGVLLIAIVGAFGLVGITVGPVLFAIGKLQLALIGLAVWGVAMIPAYGLGLAGSYLIQRGQSFCQLTAEEKMAFDRRPALLFLRPFDLDVPPVDPHSIQPSINSKLWRMEKVQSPPSLERMISARFSRHGPFIAVGDPRKDIYPLGAGRMELGNDWLRRVEELMKASRAIVLIPSDSEGVRLEIESALRLDHHAKFLIVFPPPRHIPMWNAVRPTVNRFLAQHNANPLGESPPPGLIAIYFTPAHDSMMLREWDSGGREGSGRRFLRLT